MSILLILALTLHPATAKPVPGAVVYACPLGEGLYIRVRNGASFIKTLGEHDLKGTGIILIGQDAYYPEYQGKETQKDDRHYCIAR